MNNSVANAPRRRSHYDIFYRRNMYINLMFHNVTRLLSQVHMQQSLTQQAIFGMNLNQLVSALGLVARNFLTTLFFFIKTNYFKNTKNNICRRGERVTFETKTKMSKSCVSWVNGLDENRREMIGGERGEMIDVGVVVVVVVVVVVT